jgi:ATP-dependent exoDNAse (exonuclease V) beta subunit
MITTKTINGYRNYIVDDQPFISVTSFLSMTADKSFLTAWKTRVGEEEANKITREAATNGTKTHKLIEEFNETKSIKPGLDNLYFLNIVPELRKINKFVCSEEVLYSRELKIAGRVDTIGEYSNVLSIIDYKTSRRPKKSEWIVDYFLQTCLYSLCWQEMTGEKALQLVLLITNPDSCQVFVEPRSNWIQPLHERYKQYLKLIGGEHDVTIPRTCC